MTTYINKTFKKQAFILSGLMILASCNHNDSESLTSLKEKEAELKTELADLAEKIKKLEGDSNKKVTLVEIKNIEPSIFKTYINIQGKIDAEESVSLSSEMPGTITKIHVKAGEQVSKGQVLAETDARMIQQSIADLQTNAELVNQLFDKQKALWEQKIGTELQYLQAKTQKESMEKKIATLQEQLKMTKIISPIDGTVDAVDIKLGQLTAPGMPAIRVVNFNNIKVKADIAESFASKVFKGNEVKLTFPDTKDTLTTKVTYSTRVINPLSRTFSIEVALDDKKEYHPNQIVLVSVNDYQSEKPEIVIPVKYIQKDVSGKLYVLIADKNKATKRFVKTGKEYNGSVEVTEGLSNTDALITLGYDGLNEGDNVEIKK